MEKKQNRTKEKDLTMKEIKVSNDQKIHESYGENIKVSKDNFPSYKNKIDKLLQTKTKVVK